jgi:glyoxylase-like metal-dependent hydrolase (beta-lactamase superfamily II)
VTLIKRKKNCLIDTGTSKNFKDIVKFCEGNGVKTSDLDMIINTHCNPDHIGSDYLFKNDNLKINLYVYFYAKSYIEDIKKQYKERLVTGFFNLVSHSSRSDHSLKNGGIVDIGTELRIIHTPSHSKRRKIKFNKDDHLYFLLLTKRFLSKNLLKNPIGSHSLKELI